MLVVYHYRDSYYQQKMEEQMNELEELKNEKTRLLTIQSQLQSLHDRFTQVQFVLAILDCFM